MFRYIHLLLCVAYLMYALPSFTKEEFEDKQINTLASVLESYQTNKKASIWPEFDLNDIPSMVHFKNGHIYSFNLATSNEWEKVSIGTREIPFTDKDQWGITSLMMHPSYPIDGEDTFVFSLDTNPNQSALNLPLVTFVHERFHLHQFEHFDRTDERSAMYANEWDEENQILIGLENWLLIQFLSENSIENKKERLKDFLAINHKRVSLLKESSIKWEDLQQRMEGLADYVSLKTFDIFPLLDFFHVENALLEMRAKKTGGDVSLVSDAIKSRHYFVGSTLGFALDLCGADWKERTQNGESLKSLLAEALPQTSQEMQNRIDLLISSQQFEGISRTIQSQLANEKNQLASLLNAFDESKGISVFLGRPMLPISGGGKNRKNCHLGNGFSLAVEDSSFSSTEDQQWRLRFNEVPYVVENPAGGRAFKIDDTTNLVIDDKATSLKNLIVENVTFKKLSIQDSHCEFSTELPGSIHVYEESIYIEFE